MTTIVAQYEGRCANCDHIIHVGERIEKVVGGWQHEACPADQPDDQPEHYDGDY